MAVSCLKTLQIIAGAQKSEIFHCRSCDAETDPKPLLIASVLGAGELKIGLLLIFNS